MQTRETALILIARQIAIHNGQQLDKLSPKQHAVLMTLAGNIMATVERNMVDFKWL